MKYLKLLREFTGAKMSDFYHTTQNKIDKLMRDQDEIGARIRINQASNFRKYINPELIKLAENLGLSLKKELDYFIINGNLNDDDKKFFSITVSTKGTYRLDKNDSSVDIKDFDDKTLRKVHKLINAIKKDHELEDDMF